jgi:hypothetical protein
MNQRQAQWSDMSPNYLKLTSLTEWCNVSRENSVLSVTQELNCSDLCKQNSGLIQYKFVFMLSEIIRREWSHSWYLFLHILSTRQPALLFLRACYAVAYGHCLHVLNIRNTLFFISYFFLKSFNKFIFVSTVKHFFAELHNETSSDLYEHILDQTRMTLQ